MSTDPSPCDSASDLVVRVHQQTRTVIDAELQRLARRVPSLAGADLAVIDAVLDDLAESLIIGRLRGAQQDTVPLLARLFDRP